VPRLSIDIDLDFVGTQDPEEARQRRPGLLREIEELARGLNYEVTQERQSYAMAHLRLRFNNSSGHPASLQFDVTFLDRVPILTPETLQVQHPFGDDLPLTMVQTFALPELAAGKAIALFRRTLARDLFDVAMLAELKDLDMQLMKTVLVVRGAGYTSPSPIEYSVEVLSEMRSVRWQSEVVPLARRPIPIDFETAKSTATEFLSRATGLTEGHREFLRQLNMGELRPGLLPDKSLQNRVAANPALLWRLRRGAESLEER
jgi:hypothetical protein